MPPLFGPSGLDALPHGTARIAAGGAYCRDLGLRSGAPAGDLAPLGAGQNRGLSTCWWQNEPASCTGPACVLSFVTERSTFCPVNNRGD